jgi:hypothetical protein
MDTEVQLLRRRLSTPRAATVVAAAALLAAAVAVTPSFAGSFLSSQRASHLFLTKKEASGAFLKKKAAGNMFVKKAEAPPVPVVGIAAGTAVFGPSVATTPGYIPTAFTSFATKGVASAVITFSGNATCTAAKPTADVACPIQILVDGQATGKVNFAPVTADTPAPAALVHTVMQTTVLQKGGHTIAVQYAGSSKATFTLKGWNLAVQAYPELPEELPVAEGTGGK